MSRVVLPTERSLVQGLVIARWASWTWMTGLVVVASRSAVGSPDDLEHPAAAVGVLLVVAAVNVVFTVSVRRHPDRLLHPLFAASELLLAWLLYVADGGVFVSGHVFHSSLALHASWPLVAVLSTAIVHGPVVGAVAGAAMGGLSGGAVGCEIGSQIGKAVDQNCLKNHHCLECGYRFRDPYA